MSLRKKIRSSFSDDVFLDWHGEPKLTTVGDKHDFVKEPDNYQGRRYKPVDFYAEKHKHMEGLPKIVGGAWGPNGQEESRLKPGTLVVCAYLDHSPYGPSGTDRLGVIWRKCEWTSPIEKFSSGKMFCTVYTRFEIRSVKKDLTLGSVFEERGYRCERVVVEKDGILRPELHNSTRFQISKEAEEICARRKNVYRNFHNLKERLLGAGVDSKKIY